ncbi:MAG: HAD hydrolase-like protein [Verrucomicrobia bacterium]|nr:HAD hydrolase-like protein [Verrucomicrobiota bacterium]
MVKLVLFDIDGTLIHTGGAGMKAFAHAFKSEFGIDDGSEKLKFAGRTDVSLVREFFVHSGIEASPKNFDRFFATYISLLEEQVRTCDGGIFPGIHRIISEMRQLPEPPLIALLTGNIKRGAEIKLNHYKLWTEFQFGGFADDHEERDCIAAIAKQRGEEASQCALAGEEVLVIGDTPLDIRCARAIKAKVLAVATGGHSLAELEEHQPDWAVADLTTLAAREILR